MDRETAELSREREASSEPSSTRPNPFDGDDTSSRKRQRISRSGSRSRSVEGKARASETPPKSPTSRKQTMGTKEQPAVPQTPTREGSFIGPKEPVSSRVTINLRTVRPDSSPASPPTPSKAMDEHRINRAETAEDLESDTLSTDPPMETPSSSASIPGSPEVEVIAIDDDEDLGNDDPPVHVIEDLDSEALETPVPLRDPMYDFPWSDNGEPLVVIVRRVANFMQFESIDNDGNFCLLRDWIDKYLAYTRPQPHRLVDSFYRYHEFWTEFPNIVSALNFRSRYFGQFLSKTRDRRQTLAEFFRQFARLTARISTMDINALQRHAERGVDEPAPDLGSPRFLYAYSYLLRKEEQSPHIGTNLERHYQWDWSNEVFELATSFEAEGGSIQALINLAEGQLRLVSRNPKLIDNLGEPCRLINKALQDSLPKGFALGQPHPEPRLIAEAHRFFETMSAGLDIIIEKQITYLMPEHTLTMIGGLMGILEFVMAYDNQAALGVLDTKRYQQPELPLQLLPKAVAFEWKFGILKKLITSTQMQLRVAGLATMCTDLLAMHSSHKNGLDAARVPFLVFLAKFVAQTQIIEYLVGTVSHPELINESGNILGFLIVTKVYNTPLATRIWHTVRTSQDPRVVEAILRMLKRILNLFEPESLLFFCEEGNALPIDAFNPVMREFYSELFRELLGKAHRDLLAIEAPAYYLCARLIRESSVISPDCPAGLPDIQIFAFDRLHQLLSHGPDDSTRLKIYRDCMADVSESKPTASGCICIINTILRRHLADLQHLTQGGLVNLVVQELQSFIAEDSSTSHLSSKNLPVNTARRELLRTIIVEDPGTISAELGLKLWNLLVGPESPSLAERNTSWSILNAAFKESPRNVFMTACFETFLPTLPPDCFAMGALEFVKEAVSVWLRELEKEPNDDDADFRYLALEQLWRMILMAPPNSIEQAAIGFLVDVYVHSSYITSLPEIKARILHSALVDRCLKQLADAAAKLQTFGQDGDADSIDEQMATRALGAEFQAQEQIFTRSLLVLKDFLEAYQTTPKFAAPKARIYPTDTPSTIEGEPLTIKYQSFDDSRHTEVKSLTIGSLNTAASLFVSLGKAAGFKSYKVYCGGKELEFDETDLCKSLTDSNFNGLFLVKKREDAVRSNTTLDVEITKHFEELWGYLGMSTRVAREIYYFLITFPIYDRVMRTIESGTTPYSVIFPRGQPFKSLYASHAIRGYATNRPASNSSKESEITRAIALVVAAISDPDVIDHCSDTELKNFLALNLVDTLVLILRVPILPVSVEAWLDSTLLERLLHLLDNAKFADSTSTSATLTIRGLNAILESSLHSPKLWESFKSALTSRPLLQGLLLEDARPALRNSIAKTILSLCNFTPSLVRVSSADLAAAFWPLISSLVPKAVRQPLQCEELLSLCLSLLQRLASLSSLNLVDLDQLMRQWGHQLLLHACTEKVGHPETVDKAAQGLANLCHCAASLAKPSQQTLLCSKMGNDLLRKHLFPAFSLGNPEDKDLLMIPEIPLLSSLSRQTLSDTILILVKDDEQQYRAVLRTLSNLVPYRETIDDGPYQYELPYFFDRSKSIRSEAGYVGLKNLSNTCYLNSLFTQLFMNVPFREFMLNAKCASPGVSQKLLFETQSLFSHMQNSFRRYVDPENLASSIRTYEDSVIDVHVQMDVDEFYNLLFDRWEGQIWSPEAKRQFRSFYGGQLVQQVKSKECPHISERLEPFSAIQCDIKGKSCLAESLQAYVDGEVMEGENKYKCSTCDRHVDAVKRACLKDIPDNLIFHLKRFDFNLRTLQRSKINDYFSFPSKIDMRPYKVEHLMDPPVNSPEDIFELVGVLVHAGTAESGHYYSFIRERPSTHPQENWVEFNDEIVSSWDPAMMENHCFGGVDFRGASEAGNVPYDKNYSAYMLFYQRSSLLESQNQALKDSSPVRIRIPRGLSNHIAMDNELVLQKYCLYDPYHPTFVLKLLSNVRQINKGQCSDTHHLEKTALLVGLNHLDQVVTRAKDVPDFSNYVTALKQMFQSCAECSRDFLEWFCERPDALRALLLKNPEATVRSETASMVLLALRKVKVDASYAYGLGDEDDSMEDCANDEPQLLPKVVQSLDKLWDAFHTNCRAWPEYFGLVANIAGLGTAESIVLLDAGFLRRSLEVISADPQLPLTNQYSRMLTIISKRIASKPVSYDAVITLLCRLLKACDFSVESISDTERRLELPTSGDTVPLTRSEKHLLQQHWVRGRAHILTEKLLQLHQNHAMTRTILIILLHSHEDLEDHIFASIAQGIKKPVSAIPCGPFLRAAITYCEHAESPVAVNKMLVHVSKTANNIEINEGIEFLQFFKDVVNLSTTYCDYSKTDLVKMCLDHVPTWAPALLNCFEPEVREGTEQFLAEVLFAHVLYPAFSAEGEPLDKDYLEFLVGAAQKLGLACLQFLEVAYLKPKHRALKACVESILRVIESCCDVFTRVDTSNTLAVQFSDLYHYVVPNLKDITVEEAEQEDSEWEASDDYSSEPMDSIAEFGGVDEVQL